MIKAIEAALEALAVAKESGGEADLDMYAEAHQALACAVDEVRNHDRVLNASETPPTGADYEHVLTVLGLREADDAKAENEVPQ